MQKLMLEKCEHVHEKLTALCIPKTLLIKTQPVEMLAALGAHASVSRLQHISVSLEATVLSKHNQHALTWPSLYETAGSSTHPLLWFCDGTVRHPAGPPASLH